MVSSSSFEVGRTVDILQEVGKYPIELKHFSPHCNRRENQNVFTTEDKLKTALAWKISGIRPFQESD
jgi:hypothetical protein